MVKCCKVAARTRSQPCRQDKAYLRLEQPCSCGGSGMPNKHDVGNRSLTGEISVHDAHVRTPLSTTTERSSPQVSFQPRVIKQTRGSSSL